MEKDKFLEMREELTIFINTVRKTDMSTMDIVDCIILNWFMEYKNT